MEDSWAIRKEVVRARLDDMHGRWDVCMPGQDDDRRDRSDRVQAVLQFRPADPRHLDVEEDAAHAWIIRKSRQQLFRGLVGLDSIAAGAQEAANRSPEGCVVVDDMYGGRHGGHAHCVLAIGRLI